MSTICLSKSFIFLKKLFKDLYQIIRRVKNNFFSVCCDSFTEMLFSLSLVIFDFSDEIKTTLNVGFP